MGPWSFLPPAEATLCQTFMDNGYVIQPAEDLEALKAIQARAAQISAEVLQIPMDEEPQFFLDHIHRHVDSEKLNTVRLNVYRGLNADPNFRRHYYSLARNALAVLIGNELAMQRRVNLSIQLPHDDSSLLPVHADVWSGDSPFELVLWIPLVDCRDTKSMYILPPGPDTELQANMATNGGQTAEELFHVIAPKVSFLTIPFGNVLIFTQNLMHGNRINEIDETRWSMNCRFKSVMAPYGDKRLGEFFEPLVIRPASYLGMTYSLPRGFND